MLRDIERKFILIQLILLGLFAWGVGFVYVVSTPLLNSVQRDWEFFCFAWEGLAFAVPLTIWRPMFRPIQRYVTQLQAGDALTPQQAALYHRQVLAYPFKVGLVVMSGSIVAYAVGSAQMRYFARLPWESVVITFICGLASGLLWGVLEYFLLEYHLRPLTALASSASHSLPPPAEQVSLKMKIFACSVVLVVAALSFFGVAAYTRAEAVLEQEIGVRLSGRMHELADLMGSLPRAEGGAISDAWRWVAAEYPVSPRGYFHLVDRSGRVVATHPANADTGLQRLREAALLPAVITRILTQVEGSVTDRVDHSKIISFVDVPGTRLKIVAVAPLHDFSPQLDQLLYSGLVGMAFALLLALGIGFLCARSITTSLAAVTRTAQSVAEKHDLTQRVNFLTNDEVGVLAHAFNRMAEGLQTYSEGLEGLVAERTRQLEERSAQLEATNRELSDFLYIASHDLRAPLINLAGFSRALQDSIGTLDAGSNGDRLPHWEALREEIGESLDFILRSVSKMDVLVNALLELSRIETRPQVTQPIDTAKLVAEILDAFHYQIAGKKISVATSHLPVISGDPVRINQVFSNLIDNAIKYMAPHPAARIVVGCEESGDEHCFFVRDNGPGIRREDCDKIFRLFMRLGGNGVAGDGIGLAAVRKIVEKHGGKVWVDSELGKGSTFWFSLPRSSSDGASVPAQVSFSTQASAEEAPGTAPFNGSGVPAS
ncbi:MAG TPA: ATP-binding protein [Candidatus Margulisiibacteriota bacterium]|nr:ATP-binding protein [Candidatus Margulisiibacteriota bacterium]